MVITTNISKTDLNFYLKQAMIFQENLNQMITGLSQHQRSLGSKQCDVDFVIVTKIQPMKHHIVAKRAVIFLFGAARMIQMR